MSMRFADGYAGPVRSRRLRSGLRTRLLGIIVCAHDAARHFQAGQQVDVARETADRRRGHAGFLIDTAERYPFPLELGKCGSLVLRAAVEGADRAALKTAFSHNVELW